MPSAASIGFTAMIIKQSKSLKSTGLKPTGGITSMHKVFEINIDRNNGQILVALGTKYATTAY